MNQPELFDSDVRALQERLSAAWKQLGDPSLTAFMRRELRNQMKQCTADLRLHLQLITTRPSETVRETPASFSKPELRILA
jgi:hypothetical protein